MVRDPDPPYVTVGRLARVHGTKGEFFLRPITDRPESTFQPGVELRVAGPEGREPDEFFPPVRFAEVRKHQEGYLIRLEGIEDRTRAEFLRGRYLLRPFADVEPAGEDELFYHQLLGMSVVTLDGRDLGTIREVFSMDPAEMLHVSDNEREYLIPYTEAIVRSVDAEEGRIVVDPPEGLLDL